MSAFPLTRVLTLNCREASRLGSESLDRTLRTRERVALGAHLGLCRSCRRFGAQLHALDAALREAGLGPGAPAEAVRELPPEARERIQRALQELEAGKGPGPASGSEPGGGGASG